MENIEHLVVVMFENRSFDNLLGWLYDNQTDPPKINIPAQNPPTFEGLVAETYFNLLGQQKVFAKRPAAAWASCPNPNQVPTPDPHEEFAHVTEQVFGTTTPAAGQQADMSGFLKNYSTTDAGEESAGQIMDTFGPGEANVINELARNFAVCDHWFAPVPSQTWPNRGFVHTGSSDGHVDNGIYELYHIPTIFNIMQDQGKSWGVFFDADLTPSLTYWQFPYVGGLRDSFHKYSVFEERCHARPDADPSEKLPAYSFVEPRFTPEFFGIEQPGDYHPPHNICRGETFLARVYQAIRDCPYRDKIMLVITFDEHGGCYDHVPPPTGAVAPEPWPMSRDGTFKFDRYGVRVPLVVISSYVEPGTVFRALKGEQPYDHTSILATLRDWLQLATEPSKFLPSPRIIAAPTLARVLTRAAGNENQNWPDIKARCTIDGKDVSKNTPLNDLQKSLVAATKIQNEGGDPAAIAQQAKKLTTYEHGAMFLQPDNP